MTRDRKKEEQKRKQSGNRIKKEKSSTTGKCENSASASDSVGGQNETIALPTTNSNGRLREESALKSEELTDKTTTLVSDDITPGGLKENPKNVVIEAKTSDDLSDNSATSVAGNKASAKLSENSTTLVTESITSEKFNENSTTPQTESKTSEGHNENSTTSVTESGTSEGHNEHSRTHVPESKTSKKLNENYITPVSESKTIEELNEHDQDVDTTKFVVTAESDALPVNDGIIQNEHKAQNGTHRNATQQQKPPSTEYKSVQMKITGRKTDNQNYDKSRRNLVRITTTQKAYANLLGSPMDIQNDVNTTNDNSGGDENTEVHDKSISSKRDTSDQTKQEVISKSSFEISNCNRYLLVDEKLNSSVNIPANGEKLPPSEGMSPTSDQQSISLQGELPLPDDSKADLYHAEVNPSPTDPGVPPQGVTSSPSDPELQPSSPTDPGVPPPGVTSSPTDHGVPPPGVTSSPTDHGVPPPGVTSSPTDHGVPPPGVTSSPTDHGVPPPGVTSSPTDHGVPPPGVTSSPTDHGVPPPGVTSSPTDHGVSPPGVTSSPTDHGVPPPGVTSSPTDHGVPPPGVTSSPTDHGVPPPGVTSSPTDHGVPPPGVTSSPTDHGVPPPGVTSSPTDHGVPPPGVTSSPTDHGVPPPGVTSSPTDPEAWDVTFNNELRSSSTAQGPAEQDLSRRQDMEIRVERSDSASRSSGTQGDSGIKDGPFMQVTDNGNESSDSETSSSHILGNPVIDGLTETPDEISNIVPEPGSDGPQEEDSNIDVEPLSQLINENIGGNTSSGPEFADRQKDPGAEEENFMHVNENWDKGSDWKLGRFDERDDPVVQNIKIRAETSDSETESISSKDDGKLGEVTEIGSQFPGSEVITSSPLKGHGTEDEAFENLRGIRDENSDSKTRSTSTQEDPSSEIEVIENTRSKSSYSEYQSSDTQNLDASPDTKEIGNTGVHSSSERQKDDVVEDGTIKQVTFIQGEKPDDEPRSSSTQKEHVVEGDTISQVTNIRDEETQTVEMQLTKELERNKGENKLSEDLSKTLLPKKSYAVVVKDAIYKHADDVLGKKVDELEKSLKNEKEKHDKLQQCYTETNDELQTLEEQHQMLKSQCYSLQQENITLTEMLEKAKESNQTLELELKQRKEEYLKNLGEAVHDTKEKTKEEEKLKSELADIKSQLSTTKECNEKLTTEIEGKENEWSLKKKQYAERIDNYKDEIAKVTQELQEASEQTKDLQKDKDCLLENVNKYKDSYEKLAAEIRNKETDWETKTKQLEDELGNYKDSLDKTTADHQSTLDLIEAHEEEKKNLLESFKIIEEKLEKAKELNQNFELELKQAKKEYIKNLGELVHELKEKSKEEENLKSEIADIKSQLSTTNEYNEQLVTENERMENEWGLKEKKFEEAIDDYKDGMEKVTQKHQEALQQAQDLQNDNEKLIENVNKYKERSEKLAADIRMNKTAWETKVKELEEELGNYKNSLDKTTVDLQNALHTAESFEEEKKNLLQTLTIAEDNKAKIAAEMHMKEKEWDISARRSEETINTYKTDLDSTRQELQDSLDQVATLKEERENLLESIKKSEDELASKTVEYKVCVEENSQLRLQLQNIQQEYDTVTEHYSRLKEQDDNIQTLYNQAENEKQEALKQLQGRNRLEEVFQTMLNDLQNELSIKDDTCKDELEKVTTTLQSTLIKAAALQRDNEGLTKNMKESEGELEVLREKHQVQTDEFSQLKLQIENMQQENDNLTETMKQNESDWKKMESDWLKTKHEMEQKCAEFQKQVSDLKSDCGQKELLVQEKEQKYNDAVEQYENIKKEHEEQQSAYDEAEKTKENALQQLQDKINLETSLQSSIAELQNEVSTKQGELEKLREKSQTDEFSQLKLQTENMQLLQEKDNLRETMKQTESYWTTKESDWLRLKQEMEQQFETLQKQYTDAQSWYHEAENTKQQLENLQKEHADVQSMYLEAENKKREAFKKLQEKSHHEETLHLRLTELQNDIATKDDCIKRVTTSNKKRENEYKMKTQQLQETIEKMKQCDSDWRKKENDWLEMKNEMKREFAALQKQESHLRSECERKDMLAQGKQKEYDIAVGEMQRAKEEKARVEAENSMLRIQQQYHDQEVSVRDSHIAHLNKECQHCQMMLQDATPLQQNVMILQRQIQESGIHLQRVHGDLQSKENNLLRATYELEVIRKERDSIREELRKMTIDCECQKTEKASVKEILHRSEEAFRKSVSDISHLTTSLQEKRRECDQQRAEIVQYKARIDTLSNDIQTYRECKESLERELMDKERQLLSLSAQIGSPIINNNDNQDFTDYDIPERDIPVNSSQGHSDGGQPSNQGLAFHTSEGQPLVHGQHFDGSSSAVGFSFLSPNQPRSGGRHTIDGAVGTHNAPAVTKVQQYQSGIPQPQICRTFNMAKLSKHANFHMEARPVTYCICNQDSPFSLTRQTPRGASTSGRNPRN